MGKYNYQLLPWIADKRIELKAAIHCHSDMSIQTEHETPAQAT